MQHLLLRHNDKVEDVASLRIRAYMSLIRAHNTKNTNRPVICPGLPVQEALLGHKANRIWSRLEKLNVEEENLYYMQGILIL